MEDQIKEKRKEKWYDVRFTIEALAVEKDVVEQSLKEHVEKMGRIKQVFIYETNFLDILKVQNPAKNIEEAFSQVVKLKLFVRDLVTLMSVIMVYGPSSVEIMGPDKTEIKLNEIQNLSNTVAGMVHQFAAAGLGGIVITPDARKS